MTGIRYEIFSHRRKKQRGEPDVFQYDHISTELRIQVIHIWGDTLGHGVSDYGGNRSEQVYKMIHDRLCRDYGCFHLADNPYETAENKLRTFLGKCNTEQALDVIELSFRFISQVVPNESYGLGSTMSAEAAIAELNKWFRWHGVGYQFESGLIVRVDSQFLHSEAVKPTLQLLTAKGYEGANEEFLKAFEHYRKGETKDCLNWCL